MNERRRLGHDIRNSMNALNLHSQVLRLCEGPELIESIDAMIEACDRLVEMMDQLEKLPDEGSAPPEP